MTAPGSKEDEFTLLIGKGLSAFGRMEMSLCDLFVVSLGATDPKPLQRVFWSVNSLEVRTAMTGAAIKSALEALGDPPELRAMWTEISERIPILSKKRAQLAHGNWMRVQWATKKGIKDDQFFVPYYAKNTLDAVPGVDPRPDKRLYLPDLEARVVEFNDFKLQIRQLTGRVMRELREASSGKAKEARPLARQARPSATRTKKESPQRP